MAMTGYWSLNLFKVIRSILQRYLEPASQYIYGFADLRGLLNKKFEDFNYGISIGRKLNPEIIEGICNGPTIEYFNHYRLVNSELAELTGKISTAFSEAGIEALPVEPTISAGDEGYNEEYLRTLTVSLSHKMVATRAGLGWIGKTDLFISREFGPRLRLVSILLREDPGISSRPVNRSKCGNCNICVEKCPANAANGLPWNVNTSREEFFDPFKCREKCSELAITRLKVNERICGLCVYACPIGQR